MNTLIWKPMNALIRQPSDKKRGREYRTGGRENTLNDNTAIRKRLPKPIDWNIYSKPHYSMN